jgi:hypothetical protein
VANRWAFATDKNLLTLPKHRPDSGNSPRCDQIQELLRIDNKSSCLKRLENFGGSGVIAAIVAARCQPTSISRSSASQDDALSRTLYEGLSLIEKVA